MLRVCPVTGRSAQSGNHVSHANNKTRRVYEPNLRVASFYSDTLKRDFQVRVSARGIRTIEKKGGLDAFLMSKSLARLSDVFKPMRKQLNKANANNTAAA